jgi:predicted dehydrogenase
MSKGSPKQVVKQFLGSTFRKVQAAMPRPVRETVGSFEDYVRARRERARLPYWERREKPGLEKQLVRIGFVGAGRYAQHHLKALSHLTGVELTALLTTGGPRARAAAKEYSIQRIFDDPSAFFGVSEIDAYVVVVPPEFLKDLSLRGLRTGKPVLLEKPPGVTASDTAELVACAKEHNTFGMVCMNRRFYSVLEHGLADLAWRGPIRSVTVETPHQVTRDRASGRVSAFDHEHYFMRMSIHGVDLARYLLGEPIGVHSLAWPNEEFHNAGASFATVLEFPGHVVATLTDAWDTPNVWRIKVVAEEAWLELEPLERGFIAKRNTGYKTPIRPDPIDLEFRPGVYAQDLHFVEAVRARRPPTLPACSLADAHRTMLLMEQILTGTLKSAAP